MSGNRPVRYREKYPGTVTLGAPAPHTHPESQVTSLVADLAAKQPLDSDLTAIAALATTSYGRALLTLADQAAFTATNALGTETLAGILELATQAETNTGTDDARAVTPLKLATRLAAAYQPLDADLTAIAALATTSYGRALLTLADQAALTAALALGTESLPGILELATQAETNTGTDDARAVTPLKLQTRMAAYAQPLDADLTTIAGLTATTDNFLVSVASAWASRTPAQVKTTLALNNVDNTSNATERAAVRALTNADLTSGTNTFPTLNQNTTGSAAKWTTARTVAITGDLAYTSPSLDGSANVTAAGTLATVNGNVGSFGSATQVATYTVNAKGLTTAAANVSIQIAESQVTSLVSDLAAKATDTAVVHLAGTETITGTKTVDVALVQTYQGSTPATPAAGKATGPYFGSDGLPYYLTPTGVVVPISIGEVGSALHSNPSFESWTAGNADNWNKSWFTGTASVAQETTDVLFGASSATITLSASSSQVLLSSVFTVASGDSVDVGAWARKVSGAGSPRIDLGIMTAPSGTPDFFDGVSTNQESAFDTLAGTFTRYVKSFSVPAGHTVARLVARIDSNGASASVSRLDFTTSTKRGSAASVLPGNSWPKEACRFATIINIGTLAGGAPNTSDGVTPVVGDRVLVRAQSTASQNGIYTVTVVGSGANGTWVRASDASTAAQVAAAAVAVTSGTQHGGTEWSTAFKATDTLGTTSMVWTRVLTDSATVSLYGNLTVAGTTDAIMATGSVGTGTFRDSVDARLQVVGVVKCATTANITLSGTQTIDGQSAGVGDLVLVKDQTTVANNGPYVVASGAWTRATWADSATDMGSLGVVQIQSGTLHGSTRWVTPFKTTDTLGTTVCPWYPSDAVPHAGGWFSTATDQTLTTATFTTVAIGGTADHDYLGLTIGTNIVTVNSAGTYDLRASALWDTSASATRRQLLIETWTGADPGVGAATPLALDDRPAGTNGYVGQSVALSFTFAAGAKVRLVGYQATGGNLKLLHSFCRSRFSARKIA